MAKSFLRRFSKKILFVCNITIAFLFLISCFGYIFNPQHFWSIGLLNLGAIYLIAALLFFILFWLFIKPKFILISLITLLISYKPLTQLIALRTATTFNTQKQPIVIRLMDWNVAQFNVLDNKKHPEVKQEMIALINKYQPDIACFQEMVCADSPTDTTTAYYKKYSYYSLNDFLNRLQFSFTNYSYNVKYDFLDNQHFGVITLSKFPIINKQTLSFSPNDYNSIFQYSDIIINGDTVRFFNVHLQSLRFSANNLKYLDHPEFEDAETINQSKSIFGKLKIGFLDRKIQSEHIRAQIDKSPYPVIICGDFNDVPNSYAYHTVGNGLKNAFVEKGNGIGRTFSGISPTLRIDNIFISPNFEVTQFTKIDKKLSDHFPIITDLQLNK